MAQLPATDSAIRKLALGEGETQTEYRDTKTPGLSLLVGKKARSWSLTYTNAAGQRRRVSLGRYPTVGLSQARTKAQDTLSGVRQSADPQEAKRAYRAAPTVADVAEEYLRLYAAKKVSRRMDTRVVRADLIPVLGDRKIVDVRRQDIQAVVRRVLDRNAEIMANRTLVIVRTLFQWAVEQGWIDTNPAAGVSLPARERSRTRSLSSSEIERLWTALDGTGSAGADAIKLLLLTGQREMEVIGARWSEIDFETALWTLPAHEPGRSKKRQAPHLVPLSPAAIAILRKRRSETDGDFVFPGRSRTNASCASPVMLDRMKERLAPALSDMDPWRIHDLRRTVRTGLSELGVAPHVAELVIGHAAGGIVKVYDRYQYLTEKRDALDRWAAHVLRVDGETESTPANVVAFAR